ncbi:hypothetical protein K458DRAFT_415569 [Lentithecium fluviatile CBS 122367]|uniref:Uncharacterized protein n=1 Tax=Lentithecium fluviatile CBS 122367 TaxID=1168545 RepID=A0A6G1JB00_9PLEO|nr:hypothetical protein K458DRAFT_415569 [Lentithecium fluviatile CBS 122367]
MEELGFDTHAIARTLADTLVFCFWEVHVDANDVEFVSGSESRYTRKTTTARSNGVQI